MFDVNIVFLCFVFLVGIHGQRSTGVNQCGDSNALRQRGTCRLGGCLDNEYRTPGDRYCSNNAWPQWAVFLCVDVLPCCSRGGSCRSVCPSGESAVNATTDCAALGTSCCILGQDRALRRRELVAQRQGVCGRLSALLAPRIIGGRVGQPADWPWMARLLRPSAPDREICAGVLVDDDTVITVAHCVYGTRPRDLKVILGDWDISVTEPEEEIADVISIELNPNFVLGTRGNDFAVIKLARPVTFAPRKFPACLPDPDIPIVGGASVIADNLGGRGAGTLEDSHCFIAGWGRTEDGRVSRRLRSAHVRLMGGATCNAVLNAVSGVFTNTLPSDVICTDTAATNTDACLYDDGGMLVCLDANNRYALVGLVSEFSCGRLPTVYTRVSNYTLPILARL